MPGITQKASGLFNQVKYYWNTPPKGKYMPFKEVAAYSFGGIGAYFIIQLGSTLIVSTTNIIVSTAIGIGPKDVYIIYLLSTIINIPLTAVRADMVDNTRGKGGKYRPYLLSMGIPTALIALVYVWFPYDKLGILFNGELFGVQKSYIAKCVIVTICNILLHFFFFFFQDAYTNLIHVLSPNTQERTDVLAIKSVVYSLAPSIMNIVNPVVAQHFTSDGKLTNIRVYQITYPMFAIVGIALTIVIFANTQEKIVQAKTHTIQIRFIDALKEVAKNKYFWIISLAGWLGFLELAYDNILVYSQSYGHTATGNQMAIIYTLKGNAALWGMLFAPFFIKHFGKKKVLVGVNLMNVVCILLMLVDMRNIWWLFGCIYVNGMFSAFEQITTPAIQADIRDYQQYRSGERIDGMFAAVATIGNLVTLATSAVLPAVQESFGIKEGNGYANPFDILDINSGDPNLLYRFLPALIIMAGAGAFLNVVPYFFYDFTEKKQKSVIRVLQVRALFEDYANNALKNSQLVEALDLVKNAREMSAAQPKSASKADYKATEKVSKKQAKRNYREALEFNEEIEISKFVCDELDKFDSKLGIYKLNAYSDIYEKGIDYIKGISFSSVNSELKSAKKMPRNTHEERELRAFCIELAKSKRSAKRAFDKYYGSLYKFEKPDMKELTSLFDKEEELEKAVFDAAKNKGDKAIAKELSVEKKAVQKRIKSLLDEFAKFNRAAKPFNDAEKLLKQRENYSKLDEISLLYDEAKLSSEEEQRAAEEEARIKKLEQEAELEARKRSKNK